MNPPDDLARRMIDFREQSARKGGEKWREHVACSDQCICKPVVFHAASRRLWAPPAAFMRAAFEQWKWPHWNIVMAIRDASTRCPLFSRVGSTMSRVSYRKYRFHHSVRFPGYHDGRAVAWWRCLESGGINSIMDTPSVNCVSWRDNVSSAKFSR